MSILAAPSLNTARLALRPVRPADRTDLVALEADPDVMRFLNGGRPVPEEGSPDSSFLTPRGTEPEVLAARLHASGRFIGWFALFDDGWVDGARTAELGYRLRREAWGNGYGSEGVRALVAQALDRMGFDRVRAQTMAVNLGSRRLLEKLGFQPVGTVFPPFPHPVPGDEQGEVIYEIWRGERSPAGTSSAP
ncbi:GNAT family N-acetyltransferase [Hydrogenophaga sp. RWCD_12]|uniref:GNAT family N-acetyltransferase n=1 Tax=Hydrogenophaga sp. RWCD_12 TaxID=3391190 RepID=UPI003985180A